jgi:hypothetical protein
MLACFTITMQTNIRTFATVDTRHTHKLMFAVSRELFDTLTAVPGLPRTHCTHHHWHLNFALCRSDTLCGTLDNGTLDNGTLDNGTLDNGTLDNGTLDNGTLGGGRLQWVRRNPLIV